MLANKTVFITGATRGIGAAIALRAAQDGAKVVVTGKTVEPHPTLPGTIHSVAEAVEEAGGKALALPLDVRHEKHIQEAVMAAAAHFGGIDVLVNNASAISLTSTADTSMKKFDLMWAVNARATYAASQACLPFLRLVENPHILNLSPPLNMQAKWFQSHCAYSISKYGMSMCTLGMAAEFADAGIAVNSLWPQTTIATAAIKVHLPDAVFQASRKPEVMADAAHCILNMEAKNNSGNFFIDEAVLTQHGVSDFSHYALNPGIELFTDVFLDD